MSGPQFMHIETYSRKVPVARKKREATRAEEGKVIQRKLTVEEICAEAARAPGAAPHVEHAKQPVLIFGISPHEVPALLEERIAEANAAIRKEKAAMPRGSKAKGPKTIRSDSPVLLTMVVSHPIPWIDPETGKPNFEDEGNRALLERWEKANVAWARLKGDELGVEFVSCVCHVDEGHPHLHFLGIPRSDITKRMDARNCHPGHVAQRALIQGEGEDAKALKRRQNRANNNAMRAFQDDYYQHVSKDVGLLRIGPKRQRVPNAVYKAQKKAARELGLANVRNDELRKEIADKEADLSEATSAGDEAAAEAAQAIVDAEDFKFESKQIEMQLAAKRDELNRIERAVEGLAGSEEELIRAQDALDEARKAREHEESQAAALRAAMAGEQAELARLRDQLVLDCSAFAKAKAEHERTVRSERGELDAEAKQLEALVEGIEAYADGRLQFRPDNQAQPFNLRSRQDAEEDDLASSLKAVKSRLEPIIRNLDRRLAAQAKGLANAMQSAIVGWSLDILTGVGRDNEDGEPTFHLAETPEGDRLLKIISPYRKAIAAVIDALPDRGVIQTLREGVTRLTSRLSRADREDAVAIETTMEMLKNRNGIQH